jgi:hypothetical protein
LAAYQIGRSEARDPSGGTWRPIQQPATGFWLCEQRLHLATQFDVSCAGGLEKGGTLRERSFAGGTIERLNVRDSIGWVHRRLPIARSSQAFAKRQPRFTLSVDMRSVSAVSSINTVGRDC